MLRSSLDLREQSVARIRLVRESPTAPGSAQPPNTHSNTNAVVRLSAARNVVLDDQKATMWRESGARLVEHASTYSCAVWMIWVQNGLSALNYPVLTVRRAQIQCCFVAAGGGGRCGFWGGRWV